MLQLARAKEYRRRCTPVEAQAATGTTSRMAEQGEPRIAVVSGGARGAYEAGVLSYVLDELPSCSGATGAYLDRHRHHVGAIHARFLASMGGGGVTARGSARCGAACR
jgi:hypothetical protein